jgi:hypothetical protein
MNDFLDSLIREIEYECYHTCVDRNAVRDLDRDSDRDSDMDMDEEMPGLVHDLDTDDEMPGLIDDDGYNEHSHLMNIYGDFHSYKEYEYDCEETLPDVDSELEVDEGEVQAKVDVVADEVQAKVDVVVEEAKEELVLEDSEAKELKELKEDIMNLNSSKDVVIEIKELESALEQEPTVEPPMEREIKQPTRSFCIIC